MWNKKQENLSTYCCPTDYILNTYSSPYSCIFSGKTYGHPIFEFPSYNPILCNNPTDYPNAADYQNPTVYGLNNM